MNWGDPWTEQEIAEVSRLLKEGLSRSQIGKAIGRNKNQVCGIINRRGLNGKAPYRPKPRARTSRPSDAIMRHRTCQYPYGNPREPSYHACGAEIVPDGRPYCDEHIRLCNLRLPSRVRGLGAASLAEAAE